ncbi:MAG TPA: VanZ family protein [Ignavibacteriaceae bacterium]|nr:VanZ family protein [Ignavibacteriaceae bacterium]
MINKLESNKKWLIYLPLIIYWMILFVATTLPSKDLPDTHVSDKIEHFTAYFILAVLLNFAMMFQNKYPGLRRKAWLFTLIIILTYAGLDELHQLFIPGRDCEVLDWVADSSGVLLGVGLVRFLINYYKYKPQIR